MRKITVNVTQKNIDEGVPCRSTGCPIWQALWPLFPDVPPGLIVVSPSNAYVNGSRPMRLPLRARRFIDRFDESDTRPLCRPFSFTLEVPECV
jgi:hypothetical protein